MVEALEGRCFLHGEGGEGNGLLGEYFDRHDLTRLKLTRIDSAINHDFRKGSPSPKIAPNTFSVRWTGRIVSDHSETYTFHTRASDGVRLWVGKKLVIDDWNKQALAERRGTVRLKAGNPYRLRLEYFENKGTASVRLSWSSKSQPKQIVPAAHLLQPVPENPAPEQPAPPEKPEQPVPPENPTPPQQPRWQNAASMPFALGEVAGGVIGGRLYLVGEGSDATLSYDLTQGTWSGTTTHAARPFAGNHHAAEVVGGKLYLLGGLGRGSEGRVQIYDPASNRWTVGASMPFAAGSSSSAAIGGRIYVAGGIVGRTTTDRVAQYNPATNTWTELASMPRGRNHAASGTDGRKLYVFGGRGPGSGDSNMVADGFDTVQVYDPSSDRWTSSDDAASGVAPLPQARGGTGKAAFLEGEFYVMGGETASGVGATPDGVYDRVDIYDPLAGRWRTGPAMPAARHGIFPLPVGERIYVAGGGTRAGYALSSVLQIFSRG